MFCLGACSAVFAAELTDQELRGKQIFREGVSASGAPITARVARGATPISATILPCAGCHGEDGKGRPEGGVKPSNITWRELTASYGHEHQYGRSHPAFDAASLARAITSGVDPADNALDLAMPRYAMSASDLTDLVAYIEVIASDLDPGLTSEVIRVGTLLPGEGPLRSLSESMTAVLRSYFADANARGGVNGRSIELVVGGYAADTVQAGWDARDFMQEDNVFALVSGYLTGIEAEVSDLAEERQIPVVGPYTPAPEDGEGLNRFSFYLLGGLEQQARVLVRQSAGMPTPDAGRMAIIHPNSAAFESTVQAAKAESSSVGNRPVLLSSYQAPYFDPVDTAELFVREDVTKVLFLGNAKDLRRLADEVIRRNRSPDLLFPGVFAGRAMFEIPEDYPGRVLLGYSSIPSDHTAKGVHEFEKLHSEHSIDYANSTVQISAFVAAKVLVEGLKRAGRDLSRERLVKELEGLADFQPGLMPPISYNSTRRIGAFGGYVVALDLKRQDFAEASKWIDLQL